MPAPVNKHTIALNAKGYTIKEALNRWGYSVKWWHSSKNNPARDDLLTDLINGLPSKKKEKTKMNEWELMIEMSNASNNRESNYFAKIITDNNFDGLMGAQSMAISLFEITGENIKNHMEAAKKIANFEEPKGIREAFRHALLNDFLNDEI